MTRTIKIAKGLSAFILLAVLHMKLKPQIVRLLPAPHSLSALAAEFVAGLVLKSARSANCGSWSCFRHRDAENQALSNSDSVLIKSLFWLKNKASCLIN